MSDFPVLFPVYRKFCIVILLTFHDDNKKLAQKYYLICLMFDCCFTSHSQYFRHMIIIYSHSHVQCSCAGDLKKGYRTVDLPHENFIFFRTALIHWLYFVYIFTSFFCNTIEYIIRLNVKFNFGLITNLGIH